MPEAEFVPRPGALRCKDADGNWIAANPRDLLYSTVTMTATQYWREESGWTDIYDKDDTDA